MKRIPVTELAALLCLVGIGLGVALEVGTGWAVALVSALGLAYILLPDRSAE